MVSLQQLGANGEHSAPLQVLCIPIDVELCDALPGLLQAVREDWYFQMYYDDLPVWGFIGKMEKLFKPHGITEFKYFVFTHIDFDVKYNDDHVIEINVSTDPQARPSVLDVIILLLCAHIVRGIG